MNDPNSIQDADPKLTEENLSKGAMKLSTKCYKNILRLCGVDYVG